MRSPAADPESLATARGILSTVQGSVHRDQPGAGQAALAMMGLIAEEYRLPLVPMERGQSREIARDDESVWSFEMTNET